MDEIVVAPGHCDGCQATLLVLERGHQWEDVLMAALHHQRRLLRKTPLILQAPIHIELVIEIFIPIH